MTRMTAFERTAQAAQVRRSKAALLPIAPAEADRVSLQVHVALDATRRKRGNLDAARPLCQVMLVTGLLIEAGYGDATFEQLKEAESILFAAFNRGRHFDLWMLEEENSSSSLPLSRHTIIKCVARHWRQSSKPVTGWSGFERRRIV
jgi:hypothetical protein